MQALRALLILILISIGTYTTIVIFNHGLGLFEIFFGEMIAMTWSGQFNLDFMCLLLLSGLWVAWRHHFSKLGIVLGLLIFVGGCPMLSAYLIWASFATKGNVNAMLLGEVRAGKTGT
jgi:hypothetical protein